MAPKQKKLVILLGSPREDGNSTRLAYAFADQACVRGYQVQCIRTAELSVQPCTGENECWKKRRPCFIDDDMAPVYPLLLQADAIVLATPVHFFTFSAALKAVIDRFYCIAPGQPKTLSGKTVFLLATAADLDPATCRPLKATFKAIADYMEWQTPGVLCVGGVAEIGDMENKPRALKQAAALAAKLP